MLFLKIIYIYQSKPINQKKNMRKNNEPIEKK